VLPPLYARPGHGATLDNVTTTQGQNCTFTQGYWKTHPTAWPVLSLTLGTVSYTQAQLLAILGQPVATELSGEQREYAQTTQACADSLLTLLNDILDFSKIEAKPAARLAPPRHQAARPPRPAEGARGRLPRRGGRARSTDRGSRPAAPGDRQSGR
jgi:hypothetical protein